VQDWWDDPNFSHGFLIPVFSGFVVWHERKRLVQLPVSPSWLGLPVIAASLGVLIVGVLGAELFLSRSSFLFLLAGLVIYFLGWNYFRAIIFPWGFLFLMIPIPAIIFNRIAFPLQLVASRLASALLELTGVPVLREGNVIQLPAMLLEVAEACSGIRSLMSLLALAVIYAYFLEPKTCRRVLLAVAAVPIAVMANGMRVVGTGLMVHWWDPEKALGFFHTFSGWVIFVVSLGMLFLVHGAMRLIGRWRRTGAS
jgi:exosortase